MSYQPTTWAKGDTITSENLNKLESAVSAISPLVITFSGTSDNENASCDVSWEDIVAAVDLGIPVYARYIADNGMLCSLAAAFDTRATPIVSALFNYLLGDGNEIAVSVNVEMRADALHIYFYEA